MSSIVYEPLKLMRKDGKMVDAVYYNNADIENVEILNIKECRLSVSLRKLGGKFENFLIFTLILGKTYQTR